MAETTLLVEKHRRKGLEELREKSYLRAVKGAWWEDQKKNSKKGDTRSPRRGRLRPAKVTMWIWTSLVTSRTFFPAWDRGTTSKNFRDCPVLLQLIPLQASTHTPGAPPQRLLMSSRLSSSLRYKGEVFSDGPSRASGYGMLCDPTVSSKADRHSTPLEWLAQVCGTLQTTWRKEHISLVFASFISRCIFLI